VEIFPSLPNFPPTQISQQAMSSSYQLAVLGCGTMGVAILSGILDSQTPLTHNPLNTPDAGTPNGSISELASLPDRFAATVVREESAKKLKKLFGDRVKVECEPGSNVAAARASQVVLLWCVVVLFSLWCSYHPCRLSLKSCKPQLARQILEEPGMTEALDGKLLVSILAGSTIAQLKQVLLPTTQVIRAMPNTPCKVRNRCLLSSNLPSVIICLGFLQNERSLTQVICHLRCGEKKN
jgi:pyrroline-5-carboxylate reductase